MGIVLDSSVLIGIERGDFQFDAFDDSPVAISVVTVIEVRQGIGMMQSSEQREVRNQALDARIALLEVVELDLALSEFCAHTAAGLAKVGLTLSPFDLVIAGTALSRGWPLLTIDSDFQRVPGLDVRLAASI